MKILLAPDAFKGTMTSEEVSAIMRAVLKNHDVTVLPMGDGGEGTLSLFAGKEHLVKVHDPLMRSTRGILKIDQATAYIEMAEASGLLKLSAQEKNPLKTNTLGTGELISYALDQQVKHLVIGIGGSATNDAGMGMLCALGVRFFDEKNNLLSPCGENLEKISKIDTDQLDSRLRGVDVMIMCDVNNPFTGPHGATYTYGVQKGGDDDMLNVLERGMLNFQRLILEMFEVDLNDVPGSGAAGGIGGALHVFLKGHLASGISLVLDYNHFKELAEKMDYVITGEGQVDHQSFKGKVIDGIRNITKDLPCKLLVVAGYTDLEDVEDVDELIRTFKNRPDETMLKSQSRMQLKLAMEKWLEVHS